MRPFLLLCPLLLAGASASAQSTARVQLGPGLGAPLGTGRMQVGGGGRAGLGFTFAERHVLLGTARLQVLGASSGGFNPGVVVAAGINYAYRLGDLGGWTPSLGGTLALGGSSLCVAGDFCGGVGPAAGVELGMEYALGQRTRLLLSAELFGQAGMVNGVDVLLLPTLWAGFSFR